MGELIEKVLKLKHLAEYQENGIVSREVIKGDNGNATLFAFSKGESLSEHTSPYNATVFILEGRAKITISGKEYELTGEEMIIMPADKPHSVEALGNFKMLLFMIK